MACPIIVGDGVANFVYTGYNQLMSYGDAAFNVTLNAFDQLINFQPDHMLVDVNYTFEDAVFAYKRPIKPDDFTAKFNPAGITLEPAPINAAQRPSFDANAPTLGVLPPTLLFPNSPGSFTVLPPDGPPAQLDVVLPNSPNIVLPPVPVLNEVLPLPLSPNINLPTFQGMRPGFNIEMPDPNVGFTPTPYTSQLLTDVKAKLESMLQGGTGLPAAVEQALMDRAVSREDESVLRLARETQDEFVTMGYSEPEGVLSMKLMEVRQEALNKRASLSRDIYIKAIDIEIENLKFAVQQGVALESVLLNNWLQMQQLILESQKFVLQVALEITNLKVTIFNAQLEQYKTDAQVFRDLIAGELAKLEIYKAELDAKKLILGINQQQIEIYTARLGAVNTMIEVYKSQLQGVLAVVQINNQRLEGFKSLVEVYAERVRAYQAEWEGYKAAAEAEGTKAQIFDTSVKAYLGQVQAWSSKNETRVELGKFDIALDQSRLDTWKGQLQKYVTDIDTQLKVFSSAVQVYDEQVKIYQADAQVETAASDSNLRAFELGMRREDNSAQIKLKNLELSIRELLENSSQLLEAKKAVASSGGSLAAAALSAVHFGASASSSASQGTNCSTSYSFNTELLPDS